MKWLIFIFSLQLAHATDFDQVWEKVEKQSDQIKSSQDWIDLKKLEQERAARHWLPRVMVGLRQFQTNDPSAVLFNRLGQGEVESSDFVPADLNEPGTESFSTSSVTIDLPLFEGGMKLNKSKASEKNLRAAEFEALATKTVTYTETIKRFSTISVNQDHMSDLSSVEKEIQRLIRKYKLGVKSSPVGYSGLLGLQGVLKKIDAVKRGLSAENAVMLDLLRMEASDEKLTVEQEKELVAFLKEKLRSSQETESSKIKAYDLKVAAMTDYQEMEKARFLPKLGAFASSNSYQGARGENSVQTVGLYLQWDLFNNDSYGRKSEAIRRTKMMQRKLAHYRKKEKSYRRSLKIATEQLESNLRTLEESLILINKQVDVTVDLYRKGRVNGLQIAQIFNNKVDLLIQRKQQQDKFIEFSLNQYQLSN